MDKSETKDQAFVFLYTISTIQLGGDLKKVVRESKSVFLKI